MEIRSQQVAVTTAGSAGSAIGDTDSAVMHGFLLDIYLDFDAAAAGTTEVTISHVDPILGNVLVLGDGNTDARYVPRETAHTTAGAVTDPDGYDRIALSGKLNVAVVDSDAVTNCLIATIRWLAL